MLQFDLIEEPWIPVVPTSERRLVSIREALLGAHDIVGLALAHQTQVPALLRQVLVPIVLDALGPLRDEAGWGARWRAGRLDPDKVDAYLDRQRPRFDLFHPVQPFAQVAGLRTGKDETKPSSLLIPAIATGNNVPLFSVRTEGDPPALTPAEAALWLLHAHCWDTAAIKSGAHGDPQVRNGKTTGNPTGPLGQLGVIVPLGRTLFETLLLNLPIRPDGPDPRDRPQWRGPVADATWTAREALGVLDLLTWQSRRIRLIAEDTGHGPRIAAVVLAAGDRLLRIPEEEPHTAWTPVTRPKASSPPRRPRRLTSGKAAWQGLDAMVALRQEDDSSLRTSRLLAQVGDLRDEELPAEYPLNVLTVGVEYGNQSAVVDNVVADTIPLPVAALRADGRVRHVVEQVADDAAALARAANLLASDLRRACGGDPTPWDKGQRPDAALVAALDPVARRLLAVLARSPEAVDEAEVAWQQQARHIAFEVVEPLLRDLPPTAFRGRKVTQGIGREQTYRAATAERAFRRKVNEILPLARPVLQREPQTIEEAS